MATVNNCDAGFIIEWETASDHNQVLVEATGGKFDIGFFGLSEDQPTPDHSLEFEITQTDEDGDHVADIFQVNVDGFPFI